MHLSTGGRWLGGVPSHKPNIRVIGILFGDGITSQEDVLSLVDKRLYGEG